MRHGRKINQLSRTKAHRDALMANMTDSLIKHKRIITTVAKAKALKRYVEPLLTRAKVDNTHNRRIIFSYLQNKESIKELFGSISEKIATRPGGYTRIIKIGFRPGDSADMAMIELVDYNTTYTSKAQAGKATTTSTAAAPAKRTRRSAAAKKADATTTTDAADAPVAAKKPRAKKADATPKAEDTTPAADEATPSAE